MVACSAQRRRLVGLGGDGLARLGLLELVEHLLHLFAQRLELLPGEALPDEREELRLLLLDVVLDELLEDLHLGIELLVRRLQVQQVGDHSLRREVLLDGLLALFLEHADVHRRVEDLLLDLLVRGEVVGDLLEELLLFTVVRRLLESLEALLHLVVLLLQELGRVQDTFLSRGSAASGTTAGRFERTWACPSCPSTLDGSARKAGPPGRLPFGCRDLLQWGP